MKKYLHLIIVCFLFLGKAYSQTIVSAPYYPMAGFDTSPYKSYKLTGGASPSYDMPFRILYPKNYDPAASTVYPFLLMLHGLGESAYGNATFGTYPVGDARRSNNDAHLKHLGKEFMNAVSSGNWPGFVVFPQNPNGNWNSDPTVLADAVEIIQTLAKTNKIDPNRICVAGLSAGAQAAWSALSRYTTFFAAATPFSGISAPTESNTTKIVHIPVWYFQGEVDTNPSKSSADKTIAAMRNIGATPIYTVLAETGHGTWAKAVAQPDYFPFLLRASKLKIHAYFGKTEFDNGEPVNVKLGITPGFAGYEWMKNGVLISGATSNEITATSLGSYTVRLKRGTVWTEWSSPLVLKIKTPPSVTGQPASVTRTAGTSSTFKVTLSGTPPFTYQWQKNGVNISGANDYIYTIPNTLKADAGSYRVIVTNALGTTTSNSATLTVGAALACSIDAPKSGFYYQGGQTVTYIGNANDSKGGVLPASKYTWKLQLHAPSGVTVKWTRTGATTGNFTIPTSLETAMNAYYKLILTVTDVYTTNTRTLERNIYPKLTEIVLKTQPEGLKVKVDGSTQQTTKAFFAVEGTVRTLGVITPQTLNGVTYKFSGWSQGGTETQNITVPVSDVTYRANFVAVTTARENSPELVEANAEEIVLYPNPSSDYIKVDYIASEGEKVKIGVVNSLGKHVKALDITAQNEGLNSATLDINSLPHSPYILRVQKGNTVFFKHFIVNK